MESDLLWKWYLKYDYFKEIFHRETYSFGISSLLTLKLLLMYEMPKEPIVKREGGEKEEDRRKKMTKNTIIVYKMFWDKAVKTKNKRTTRRSSLNKQIVLKRTATAVLLKNHRSFIVKQPLPFVKQPGSSEKVFHVLISDMLLKWELVSTQLCRKNRREAAQYGPPWNVKWIPNIIMVVYRTYSHNIK